MDSGEYTGPSIHKKDITVLYGNVSKIEEEPWNQLPKITRQWFIDNPYEQCPSEFLSSNNNNKKKSTQSVSFAETDDDSSGGEDGTEGDSSSSEDDDSSTSSDGSGDFSNH